MENKKANLSQTILKRLHEKNKSLQKYLENDELKDLIQEFDVYEAELLAQNHELMEKDLANQELAHELEIIFNNAPVAYMILNHNFKLLKYNIIADKCFSLSLKPNVEMLFVQFLAQGELKKFISWFELNKHTQEEIDLKYRVLGNPKTKIFKTSVEKYSSDENKYLFTLIDVSKEYELKNEINQLKKELESN